MGNGMSAGGYDELQAMRERLAVLEEARRNGDNDIAEIKRGLTELHARISASKEDLSRQITSAISEWREARLADEAQKVQAQKILVERRETDRKERLKTAISAVGIFVTGAFALLGFFGQLFGWFQ